MSFFEKHYEYIEACIRVRALEIAYMTKRYSDVDDYMQDMRVYFLRYSELYQQKRSSPHTFINRLALSAKTTILRRIGRGKNRIIAQAEKLEYA